VRATTDIGRAIIFVGALSFIGLGAEPPLPEWGTMLADARGLILGAWWYVTFPGLAIAVTALVCSLLGDVLDELLRPM
jgi:dipeptide transport system permease protein